jgi:23S rRNA G2445 N2-methylase RlmL
MPRFLALTSKGLGVTLENELKQLDFKVIKASQTKALFECNWQRLYEAHLRLRTATRIIMPVLDFSAYNNEDLYNNIKRHDFTKYISPDQSLKIITSIKDENGPFNNGMFVSQKIKDSIVDMFRDKFNKRPNVDKNADLQIFVKIKGANVSVSIDLTGESLTKRGYRKFQGEAPLREHIAAGLLLLSHWKGETPLVDPMCGSGTFLIEGALIAINKGPGLYRKNNFAFCKHLNFQKESWEKAQSQVKSEIKTESKTAIWGFDVDPRMINSAIENIKTSELTDYINVKQLALRDLKNPVGAGALIVCNPPYGERLKAKNKVEELYIELSRTLKTEFKGCSLWMLSGDKDLTPFLRLKSEKAYKVDNNGIDCKWLRYDLY